MFAVLLTMVLPGVGHAQAPLDTVGVRTGGVGVHGLTGAFVGRFDAAGGSRDLAGVRAGVGFGEILDVTGFYWQSVDADAREFDADRAFGAEARFALNAGFGVAPFLAAGIGRLEFEDADARTAAMVGAGLRLPLGPVLLAVSAHDYILGVTGLDGDETEDTSHNWLYSAGITFAFGRSRRTEPIVVQRPPAPVAPEVAAAPPVRATPGRAEPAVGDGVRNYQSDRTIEVPIPLEGSITLRYGPEPGTTSTPPPEAGAAAGVETMGGALRGDVAYSAAEDPLLRTWLRQVIGAEVAAQLAARGGPAQAPTAASPGTTTIVPLGGDAGTVQRALDATLATLVTRLAASDAQRTTLLRNELRQTLTREFDAVRAEMAGMERRLAGDATGAAVAPPLAAQQPAAPTARAAPTPADPAAGEAAAATERLRTDATIRLTLAEAAARHPGVLSTAETVRGPAIVVADVAFETGAALLDERALAAIGSVAAALHDVSDRRIYVHGHTDAVGEETSNQLLSELRAETVRSLLVQAGIAAGAVYAVGFGEGRPLAGNETAAGRATNRRVEIVVGEPRTDGERRIVLQERNQ